MKQSLSTAPPRSFISLVGVYLTLLFVLRSCETVKTMKHRTGILPRRNRKVSEDGCFCAWLSVDIASFLGDCFIIKSDTLEDFCFWRKVESQFALFILSREIQECCWKRFSQVSSASSSCAASRVATSVWDSVSQPFNEAYFHPPWSKYVIKQLFSVRLTQKLQQLFKQRCEWVCVHCQMLCKYDGSMK